MLWSAPYHVCQEELLIWGGRVPLASGPTPRGAVATLAHMVQDQALILLHLAQPDPVKEKGRGGIRLRP